MLRQAKYSSRLVYNGFESLEVEDIFVPKLFEHIYALAHNETSSYLHTTNLGNCTYTHKLLMEMHSIATNFNDFDTIEHTIAYTKDFKRCILCPIIITVKINRELVRAIIDSGLLADFMSTKFVDQISVRKIALAKLLPIQLAVQGSRSKVNYCTNVRIQYREINSIQHFDIINLNNYDIILGTLFLFQHWVSIGFNDSRLWIESAIPLPITGEQVTVISSKVIDTYDWEIDKCRQEIKEYTKDLFKDTVETPLPLMRAINHTIPLIDEDKKYKFRRATCLDPLQE